MAGPNDQLFWEVISTLFETDVLPYVMIVGSWAEFVYAESLGQNLRPGFRTMDMDIMFPNIRVPAKKIDLTGALENLGFVYDEDLITGISKFFQPDGFQIDFLARSIGRGTRSIKVPSTNIKATTLRSMNILAAYPLTLEAKSFFITVPEPCAYIIQKLMINSDRGPIKQQKDLDSIEYLARNLEKYGYAPTRLRDIFNTLSIRKKKAVLEAASNTTFDFSDILTSNFG
jgi:hypothetical protein